MKIDKPGKPLSSPHIAEGGAHAAPKGKSSPPPAAQQSGTSVSLGSTVTQLRSMESSMAGVPVADAGKVAEIKQAISEGRFKVNTEIIADRLIETVHDLIGRRT